jgi:hypothetical protein
LKIYYILKIAFSSFDCKLSKNKNKKVMANCQKQYAKTKMGLGESSAVTTCQPSPSGLLGIPTCGFIGILERS